MNIHKTAIVDETARLAPDVAVEPFAVIGAGVVIGAGSTVGSHAVITGPAEFGEKNVICAHTVLGGDPQDLKYRGEKTELIVGSRNIFREFCTVHRGTVTGRGKTVIGDDNLFMAYTHVAHDCKVGSRTVFANGASLAGHCDVGDDAILGAFAGVRQFSRVGAYAFVGAFTPANKDILPFLWTSADRPTKAWKVNSVGLARKGFSAERVDALQKAYRALYRHRHDHAAMLAALAALSENSPDVLELLEFIKSAQHGIHGS
ncbi:MAG: Acyl-[acyl-carrier-protein]--UDP-N-acetylglucosamine O-acyltransferase [Thermoanaerobaculia bacterium]|nr:Acyl-[acyl-carrier-protein]--UDP-N-acetylglucosamine O-acyltransferase [Thermoanaerobaculia bacterium]